MDTYLLQLLEWTGKIILSGILGGLIGYERETHGQAAGFRTNILVALGACLMMLLSLHMASIFGHLTADSTVRVDPGRIASYAIASMGFLGAGAIIKGQGTVRGLTTAAGLWMVTALGLAVGAGFIIPAILTTIASLIILYFMRRFIVKTLRHDSHSLLTLHCKCDLAHLRDIKAILDDFNLAVTRVNYHQDMALGETTYRLRLKSKDDITWGRVITRLQKMEGIRTLDWEEAGVP